MTVGQWPSTKAAKVFRALLQIGYAIKSQRGSHVILTHPERGDYVWAFHDGEIGPKMLAELLNIPDCAQRICSSSRGREFRRADEPADTQ